MLELKDILKATGGRRIYGKVDAFSGVAIDSRTIKEGELFVALKGRNFDGHDFLKDALTKGGGALVSIPPAVPLNGKAIIHVGNTLKAVQDMARYIRMKSAVPVIGITGTNGKTTTKEMTASILGTKYRVLKNTGNLNNQIGLPLSLIGLDGQHEVAVLEMGASSPGDIRELCRIALPDFGVITNIGHAHIEGFGSLEALRSAKLELLETVKTVCVNADDGFLLEGLRGYEGRVVRYSAGAPSDVYASDITLGKGSKFLLHSGDGGDSVEVNLKVAGLFNIYNALAASSAGHAMGIGLEGMKAGLEVFEGVPMRFEVKSVDDVVLLSDVYNANPASMEEALKELVRLKGRRAVAVLGDMLELGPYGETAHRSLGERMSGLGVDLFIAVGPLMAKAADAFGGECIRTGSAEEAGGALKERLGEGDTVLVKGSRGMRMEKVLENVL